VLVVGRAPAVGSGATTHLRIEIDVVDGVVGALVDHTSDTSSGRGNQSPPGSQHTAGYPKPIEGIGISRLAKRHLDNRVIAAIAFTD